MSQEDIAQDLELKQWEQNNSRRALQQYAPTDPKYGPALCEECDDQMPAIRRSLGKHLCTSCQDIEDRRKKLFRH